MVGRRWGATITVDPVTDYQHTCLTCCDPDWVKVCGVHYPLDDVDWTACHPVCI